MIENGVNMRKVEVSQHHNIICFSHLPYFSLHLVISLKGLFTWLNMVCGNKV